MVRWLLEYGDTQITDTNNKGESVWTGNQRRYGVGDLDLNLAFMRGNMAALKAMLRVMVLHGAPPESVADGLAPPLQRILQDGAAAGTAPSVPNRKAGPRRRALPAVAPAREPGARLRESRHN
jgi:hypothetical protein